MKGGLNMIYHFARNKLQEYVCQRDLGIDIVPNLLPESQIRREVKETNYLLANQNSYQVYGLGNIQLAVHIQGQKQDIPLKFGHHT